VLALFDVFSKRSLNFINRRCLVSDNAVVSFVARHGVFHSRMFSCIGRNFQFCCNVQCCADIIRELVMVREGLLVLSDSRISKDDVCAAIEHLCVE